MFEDTSMLQEFGRYAKRHFGAFNLAERLIASGISFLLIGSATLTAQTPTKIWTDETGDNNWFTGPTEVSNGNWAFGGNPAPTPGPGDIVAVNNGTTAQIGAAGAVAGSLFIGDSLPGSPAVAGSTLQLLSGGDLTGPPSVTIGSQGTLRYSGGSTHFLSFLNNGLILIDSGTYNFPSPITGSGGLTYADSNTSVLVGPNNTYRGETQITAGILQAGSTTALSPNSAFVVDSTLDLNGFSNTIGSLSGVGTVLNNVAGTATLTVGQDNTNTTFSGALENGTGVLALTKIGTGTLTLTGTNIYSGGTNLNGGILAINIDGNLGTGPLSFNGGTLEALSPGGGIVSSKLITLNALGGTFQADGGTSSTLNGVISGTGGLVETGTGTLTLTGLNTYTGGTTISTGTLQLGNGVTNGSIVGNVTDNGTLAFDPNGTVSFGAVINGSGKLTKLGDGMVILTGTNTYGGGTTINAGILQLGNGLATGTIVGNVIDNGTLAFDHSNTLTFAGNISGTGNITQVGSGTTILSGQNTLSGTTTISAGTLQINNPGSISGNVVNNAVLDFQNSSSAGGVTITNNGSPNGNPGGLTMFHSNSTAGDATIINEGGVGHSAGNNSDTSGGLTNFFQNSNAGSATITNEGGTGPESGGETEFDANSSAGNSTIITNGGTGPDSGGETEFVGNATGGTARAITNGNGVFDISQLSQNTPSLQIGSIEGSGSYFLGSKMLVVGGNNLSTTVSGTIQDGSEPGGPGGVGGSLVKVGTGTLTLTGTNTYTGGTTISTGTLQLGNGVTNGSIVGNVTDNGTLAFDPNGTVSFGAVINGSGKLTKLGDGTVILTGTNNYGGGTTLNGGILAVNSDLNLGTGALSFNGGTLEALVAGGGITSSKLITLNTLGGAFQADGGTSSTLSGVINGTGGLVKTGAGTLTLTGRNTYSGGTTFNGGILAVNSDLALGTGALTFNGGTLEALAAGGGITSSKLITLNTLGGTFQADGGTSSTLSGVIGGTGGLVKTGTGILTLAGRNTYSGGTTLNGGILAVNSDVNVGTGALTFNGGTLEALTAGGGITSSKLITLNTLGGTFQADGGTSSTLSGVISGTGGLVKTGAGTLTLTGRNTYSGGTTLNGGVLAVNSDVNLGTGALSFNGGTLEALSPGGGIVSGKAITLNAGGGTFLADAGTSSTLRGVISGTGSLTKNGLGLLTLTGANTYVGGTNLNGGILAVNSDGNLGTGPLSFNGGTLEALTSGGGIVSGKAITLKVGGGTFLADPSTSSTLRGAISGGGSLTKNGLGTLILTGTNTYTGGTKINAGTVQIGNGGTTGSITGDVLDDGTLAFNRSDSMTFGRVISGTGNVVQEGTGTLTVTGINTYTGTTTVDRGSLIVNGSVASAQTLVNSGAFLGGHGTIGGNLVNSGTVSQINSPGTLTVTGNYTQNPGGTLRIGVAGAAPGQHDLLAVGGHATLGGALQLISLGGFSLQPGNQITFLTADKGVSGTFSNTQNGLVSTGTIVQAQVATTSNSAVLITTQGSFTNTPDVATNPNNVAVAKALDSARGDPREAALFAFLNSQPLANLPNDLTLIAPTQVSSINATAVSVAKVQIANVAMRLAAVHAGSTGFSSAGLSINSGVSFEGLAGPSGSEGKSGPAVFAPTPDNRWGVFLTGLGEFTNVYSTPEASGYDVDTGGFTFGVDYRLTPNIAIGLTGGYAHTNINLDAGGNIDVNGGKLGAYATIFGNGFYLDTAVTGGPSGYQTRRTALQGTASGSTGGADFNVMVAGGYDWTKGNLTITPTASFQYSYVGLNSFTETGSLAPLAFPNQNTQSELSAFGAKATYNWKIGKVIALPQVSAAWQHEYGATAYSVIAGFASGAGNSFTVTGPDIGRDSLLIGAGATVILNDRVSTYLYYDGEFARTNYLSNNVSGGVRVSF